MELCDIWLRAVAPLRGFTDPPPLVGDSAGATHGLSRSDEFVGKVPLVPLRQAAARLSTGCLLQRMPAGFPRGPSRDNGGAPSLWIPRTGHKRRHNKPKQLRNVPILKCSRNENGRSESLRIGRALIVNRERGAAKYAHRSGWAWALLTRGPRAFDGRWGQNVLSPEGHRVPKFEGWQVCCRDHSRIFRYPLNTDCMAANKVTAVHRGRRSHFRRTTLSRRELPDRLFL